MAPSHDTAPPLRVRVWLAAVCLLIIAMVVIGGITRLTGSGLSMVEWKPIMGAIPPLSDGQWRDAFSQYQQYPQFKISHPTMALSEFKQIFLWEYLHRLLGRAIGLFFLLPWLVFTVTKKIDRRLAVRLSGGFLLGALQGAMGWFMVMSGLVDRPQVSHYRLAAHLLLALITLSYLFWILLDITKDTSRIDHPPASPLMRRMAVGLTSLVFVQITFGAFVAGLKAGHGFNTFPSMNGFFIPPSAFAMTPFWHNIFDNPVMLQFIHRMLGFTVAFVTLGMFWARPQRRDLRLLTSLVLIQFGLGVSTLVLNVPITLAVTHQFCACLVLLASLWVVHRTRPSRADELTSPG